MLPKLRSYPLMLLGKLSRKPVRHDLASPEKARAGGAVEVQDKGSSGIDIGPVSGMPQNSFL